MKLSVDLPQEVVSQKLNGIKEVEKIEAARGGTLIIVNPQTENSELRMSIENLLLGGKVIWLS